MFSTNTFTEVLQTARAGDAAAEDHLWALIYDELRRVAHGQLQQEHRDHTLSTTALVHEAYLRMVGQTQVTAHDRNHFVTVAARVMRHILVDYARKKHAQKRGGQQPEVPFDEALYMPDLRPDELIALDEALTRLEQVSARLSKVVECCYFGGLTQQETADVLGISVRTVERDWLKAKGWLYHQIYGPPPSSAAD